jgi:hypothetical protein
VCAALLVLGTTCASDNQCQSNHCSVEGVCCDAACIGNCEQCSPAGHCATVTDGTDPRHRCQTAGGSALCAGTCQSGQCAFPGVGTPCGTCEACDNAGGCTQMPPDDTACGTILCTALNTDCRAYQNVTTNRCAALGACKLPNASATCTQYTDLPCTDGGMDAPPEGGPQHDAGTDADGPSGSPKSGGCTAAPQAPAFGSALATLLLGLALAGHRRQRR